MMCAPSRAAILLGGYQQRVGFYGLEDSIPGIPNEHKLAPAFFKEQGYATGIIGKWHLGGEYDAERGPRQKDLTARGCFMTRRTTTGVPTSATTT